MVQHLVADRRGYIAILIEGMVTQQWQVSQLPSGGRLAMNRQKLILRSQRGESRLVLHVYSVTGTGRNRSNERRIEITSTYTGGSFGPISGYDDVVLGYDRAAGVFVGFDARRLHHGGHTHNASSFFPNEGIRTATQDSMHIYPRDSGLFGTEYHAFFPARRAAEYLLNRLSIHSGSYGRGGPGSERYRSTSRQASVPDDRAVGDDVVLVEPSATPIPHRVRSRDVEAIEAGGKARVRNLSPESLDLALRRAAENGALGERFIFAEEVARLRKRGLHTLADNVEWISRVNTAAGFDILSFETDGSERFIEVKSTQGWGDTFNMSLGEWRVAVSKQAQYLVARVRDVRGTTPSVDWYRDPEALRVSGQLRLDPSGYLVTPV